MANHFHRQLAAFKGVLDAGLDVPHRESFFPEGFEKRIDGSHIQDYAKMLAEKDEEKYKLLFSNYLKKIDPLKITKIFNDTLNKLKIQLKNILKRLVLKKCPNNCAVLKE